MMNVRSTTSGLTGHQTLGSQELNPTSTIMEVDAHIGMTTHKPKSRTEEEWNRVGTEEDIARLEQKVREAAAPVPGGTAGGHYP